MLDEDGTFVIGYRVRNGHDGIDETVIARSEDGERFTTVATLEQSEFGAKGMERPPLVRTETGRWHLYVCCADPGSPHWWISSASGRGTLQRKEGDVVLLLPALPCEGVELV